ncbi:MAG: type II CAAX prenyl endopeptidase Rce1 family protein [Nannocystaceae bacterium]
MSASKDTDTSPKRLCWASLLMPPVVMGVGMFGAGSVLMLQGVAQEAIGEAISAWVFPLIPGLYGLMVGMNFLLLRRSGQGLRALLWGRRVPVRELALGVCVGLGLAVINQLGSFPLIERLNGPEGGENFDPALNMLSVPELVVTVIFAVLAEDLLYRGYSLFSLREHHGPFVALVATALAYALFNLGQGPWMFTWAIVLGLAWSGLALWRGCVAAVLVGHLVVSMAPRCFQAMG